MTKERPMDDDLSELIERKLDELEAVQPSDGDYLDRQTRREALETIAELGNSPEERVERVAQANLGALFQASMF
ncbi:hypothetical protein F7D09_1508 [Bifidobacterium leontopitheci]|uniref:Uncharacterized protein n=2 Tax=Bifidobacterium leontopitheci TaxID=2650774 RepID=A0A6I1GPF7_9BIFI|nr:hypothetical protein F7D09_1508 [Bifidobacterium leontopitheci]